jgi:hypothetical protein
MTGSVATNWTYLDPANIGTDWHIVGTPDLNKDGNADLLLQHDAGWLGVYYLNKTKLISFAYLTPNYLDLAWRMVGTADLNNDGQADLMVQSISSPWPRASEVCPRPEARRS